MLLAGNETNPLKLRKMLRGFHEIAGHQIGFTEMLVRPTMTGIERERLLIVAHSVLEMPQATMSIAEIVLEICIAHVAQCGGLQRLAARLCWPAIHAARPTAAAAEGAGGITLEDRFTANVGKRLRDSGFTERLVRARYSV
jgi:hypothetical protein